VFVAFDLLFEGDESLVGEPYADRRRRLERLLRRSARGVVLAESLRMSGQAALAHARARGWEGVIAKRLDAAYEPGKRTGAWRKVKAELQQEFVVGGWTEPRNSREHIGALLVGVYDDDGRFVFAGAVGTGLTRQALADVSARLAPLERKTPAFANPPRTRERAHWVRPSVVVEVKFNEWTQDGVLRQPAFLGVRDDKAPRDVRREEAPRHEARIVARGRRAVASTMAAPRRNVPWARRRISTLEGFTPMDVVAQLDAIEMEGGAGPLWLGPGRTLDVTNLGKPFFGRAGVTKGDVMRYYALAARAILPAVADRPLVLRRFPNGVNAPAFYQQRAPERVPPGVRVEPVANSEGEPEPRLIGGDLLTLLYTVQLGAISVDPWHGRVADTDAADYAIVDLDPGPRAPFARVVEVALLVKEAMDALGVHGGVKTSGATGLHVVLPLAPGTSAHTARTLALLIATHVALGHPRVATVERSVAKRPPGAVYVDYLQNIRGKTVASVYSVRARPGATVSTPLDWEELAEDLDPRAFDTTTVPERLERRGDLWATAMRRPNRLEGLGRGDG
jgi:bifunctional non-homologous end joining protein LigD